MKDVPEVLASELHRQYRATNKALDDRGIGKHDHGWLACGRKDYFRKRAALIIRRSQCTSPATLGEAEQALESLVLLRRLAVEGK